MGRSSGYTRQSRYDYDRDYDTNRYGSESSRGYDDYGYKTERDYDLGRESDSGGYFTGGDYGRGYKATSGYGSYDRDYEYGRMSDYNRDYDRDYDRDYNRDYERDYGRGYGSRSSYTGYTNPIYGGGYGTGFSSRDYERDYGPSYGPRYERTDYSLRGGRGRSDYQPNRLRSDYDYQERGFLDKATDEVASWFGDEDAAARRRMDAQLGEHRGRGPRGYKRSDERIKEDINDRLTYDSFIDASDVEVSVANGEVILSGTVNSRSAKRYAEDIAELVSGVTNVENHLRVKHPDYGYTSDTASDSAYKNQLSASGTTSAGKTGTSDNQTTTTGTSTTGTNLKTKTA
jgi:osmotically-inducible protein OsmY